MSIEIRECKYCRRYIELAQEKISGFREACASLQYDPAKTRDHIDIVRAFLEIGQFGTIRLARKYPFITDEAEFKRIHHAGLEFYWMVLDVWEELAGRKQARDEKAAQDAKEKAEVEAEVAARLKKLPSFGPSVRSGRN